MAIHCCLSRIVDRHTVLSKLRASEFSGRFVRADRMSLFPANAQLTPPHKKAPTAAARSRRRPERFQLSRGQNSESLANEGANGVRTSPAIEKRPPLGGFFQWSGRGGGCGDQGKIAFSDRSMLAGQSGYRGLLLNCSPTLLQIVRWPVNSEVYSMA